MKKLLLTLIPFLSLGCVKSHWHDLVYAGPLVVEHCSDYQECNAVAHSYCVGEPELEAWDSRLDGDVVVAFRCVKAHPGLGILNLN